MYLAVRLKGFRDPDLCFAEVDCEMALNSLSWQCIQLSLEYFWGNGHQLNWPGARAHSKVLLPLMLGLQLASCTVACRFPFKKRV